MGAASKLAPAAHVGKRPRGRPSIFSPALAKRICDRLTTGETLRSVCRSPDMPTETTVRVWAINNVKGFYVQYTQARDLGYRAMADEVVEIADDGSNDYMERRRQDGTLELVYNAEHVNRSRLRVDTRKWLLSKALPKIYGDKVALEHTGADGGPIQNSTQISIADLEPEQREQLRAILLSAKARQAPTITDVEHQEVDDEIDEA